MLSIQSLGAPSKSLISTNSILKVLINRSNKQLTFLTILNPNKDNKNTFDYEGYHFEIDFKRVSFIFATTEPQDVFHALVDRLERIDLEDYTYDDLAQILQLNIDKIKFEGDILSRLIAPTLRGNARAAAKMATHIKNYCSNNDFWVV